MARENERKAERKARGVLGGMHQKMVVKPIPGYQQRWVNDEPGRLQLLENQDYEFVTDETKVGDGVTTNNTDLGARVSMIVGKNEDGSPKRAYLMKIRQDWYDDDQRKKQEIIDETDEAIVSGSLHRVDESYIPDKGKGIKMSRSNARMRGAEIPTED